MDIVLHGLTHKQKTFCDVMWTISTHEGVENFIRSLPAADQRDCRSLVELMQLAFLDEVTDVSDAKSVLSVIFDI